MNPRSPMLSLRVRGPMALFTIPEFKAERVSYPVMTPSAARGILEAVLWKPAIRWHVRRIAVLAPIKFIAFRRNEVNSKARRPDARLINEGGMFDPYFADLDRAQRNTIALRDVDYLIHADFSLTDRAGDGDNVPKFVDMFTRRVERGQYFHHPYLGSREFPADIEASAGTERPIEESRDLGLMLWDIIYAADGNRARFFRARLESGVLHVPEDPEATIAEVAA